MQDTIETVLRYLQTDYGAPFAVLDIGYKVEKPAKVMCMIPNYPLVIVFSGQELLNIDKTYGRITLLRTIDNTIEKMLLEYRNNHPDWSA